MDLGLQVFVGFFGLSRVLLGSRYKSMLRALTEPTCHEHLFESNRLGPTDLSGPCGISSVL